MMMMVMMMANTNKMIIISVVHVVAIRFSIIVTICFLVVHTYICLSTCLLIVAVTTIIM